MAPIARLCITVAFISTALAQSACYWKPDTPITDLDYVPCGSEDGFSACCHLSDICLEQAACYSPQFDMTYISGCTGRRAKILESARADNRCRPFIRRWYLRRKDVSV